jgi:hypothetical protein
MTVRVERSLSAGMPQPFLDDLWLHALFQKQ